MIKDEHRVIIFSFVGGMSLWIIDAFIDSVFFSHGSFPDLLILDLSFHEFYLRSLFLLSFVVFGFVISRMLAKRRKAEEALRKSEEKYRSLVESAEDSIYLVDRNYRYLFINKKHLSRLKLPAGRIVGKSYGDLHLPEETKEFAEKVDEVFKTGESIQHEHRSMRDDRYFLRTFSPVIDPEGKILAVTVVSKHITDRKMIEEDLRTLSLTDELTALYNRRGFLTLAEQQMKIAGRLNKKLLLLFADFDGLKLINDTLGHQEGDKALTETAALLRESFRESDIIARIGGDEFAVLFTENIAGDSEMLASRLQGNINKRNLRADSSYRLSISTGVVHCDPAFPESVEGLLLQADKLMYEKKKLKKSNLPPSG